MSGLGDYKIYAQSNFEIREKYVLMSVKLR
jgi:hypothetical protein